MVRLPAGSTDFISMVCILLCSSAVRVHDSQADRKMDILIAGTVVFSGNRPACVYVFSAVGKGYTSPCSRSVFQTEGNENYWTGCMSVFQTEDIL